MDIPYPSERLSAFSKRLMPVGRILETPGWYVWCVSPIFGPDGKVHVFYSRWPASFGMGGWIHQCEIARAVADNPEGPYRHVETILAPRGPGHFDATTCHNPHIQCVDGKYALFFMGNSNGKTDTKRIGLALADSLEGPWQRPDVPLLEAGPAGAWDDHCTSNPAFVRAPRGEYRLYYKSWNTAEFQASTHPKVRGNRKYGLAVAPALAGPYVKHVSNPILDFSKHGRAEENIQFEDAYVWYQDGLYHMLARDMGIYDHQAGLHLTSHDGLQWSEPMIGYLPLRFYRQEPPAPKHLNKYGRLERPQILMRDGKPAYLFCAAQGGMGESASGFVFRMD